MFQFPGFALKTLCIQVISTWLTRLLTSEDDNNWISGGFPHSDIHGSKPIPGSPWLNAGYHVLHRLLLPRHPPNALIALDLIRKTKDPRITAHRSRATWLARSGITGRLPLKACIYSRPFRRKDLVSVLDLDNAAVCSEEQPNPHAGTADNAVISLNDVNAAPGAACVRLDGKASQRFPIKSGLDVTEGIRGSKVWWSLTESNRRHPACKAGALPTELRPPTVPEASAPENVVGRGGLEPPTSRLSGVRSNHLSYRPKNQTGRSVTMN